MFEFYTTLSLSRVSTAYQIIEIVEFVGDSMEEAEPPFGSFHRTVCVFTIGKPCDSREAGDIREYELAGIGEHFTNDPRDI